jgi:hypothetical protein
LGKYPDNIPSGTAVQAFPIPTPLKAVTEYAKAELLGTIPAILVENRAAFKPYKQYEI